MFEEAVEYLPLLIRIAAVFIVFAVIYDFFKRKWAKLIVDAVNAAGADSPENAVSTAELEASHHGITRIIRLLLRREYSTLRRYVLCVKPERDNNANTKIRKKCSDKLVGEEKWYILPALSEKENTDESGENAARSEDSVRSTPALLRLGGEQKPVKLIVGCVLTVVFTELIIYFLPQIVSFFTEISKLGRN